MELPDGGSVSLALGAGLVAAVNPCGFALLPAYLSLFVLTDDDQPTVAVVVRALRATVALTLGFAGVFVAFGLAIAPVASSVQAYLPAFTVVLGVLVALVGLWVLVGRSLPTFRLPGGGGGTGKPIVASWPAMTGFGASYAIASLGCTIAPFLAVVVASFRSGSTTAGVVLFLCYALGMGLAVGVASVGVALARRGVVGTMRRLGGLVPRLGGLVLLVAGAYVAWYGVWELRVLHAGAGGDPLVEAAADVQTRVVEAVEWLGLGGAALVLAVLALLAGLRGWSWSRHTASR